MGGASASSIALCRELALRVRVLALCTLLGRAYRSVVGLIEILGDISTARLV